MVCYDYLQSQKTLKPKGQLRRNYRPIRNSIPGGPVLAVCGQTCGQRKNKVRYRALSDTTRRYCFILHLLEQGVVRFYAYEQTKPPAKLVGGYGSRLSSWKSGEAKKVSMPIPRSSSQYCRWWIWGRHFSYTADTVSYFVRPAAPKGAC